MCTADFKVVGRRSAFVVAVYQNSEIKMFYDLMPQTKGYFVRQDENKLVYSAFAAALAILESNKND